MIYAYSLDGAIHCSRSCMARGANDADAGLHLVRIVPPGSERPLPVALFPATANTRGLRVGDRCVVCGEYWNGDAWTETEPPKPAQDRRSRRDAGELTSSQAARLALFHWGNAINARGASDEEHEKFRLARLAILGP